MGKKTVVLISWTASACQNRWQKGSCPICKWGVPPVSFLGEKEINKQWMVHSPRAPHPISCMAASNGLLGVSFYWHGTKQVPRARWLDSPPQTRPVDKSKQNAPAELRDIVMLGWNEEVQWRGEGLRAQLHGAAAALRPSAHGAGESWKNFILQTQGIAGTVASTALFSFILISKISPRPLHRARFFSRFIRRHLHLTGKDYPFSFGAGAPQHQIPLSARYSALVQEM